jgi:4-diphosphocytidyl-2-C-methyl-D-erythritol kinase
MSVAARAHPHVELAPAKINLSLEVIGRRADGYHEIHSLVVFADCGDRLTGELSSDWRLDMAGPFAGSLVNEPDNLVSRAAILLGEHLEQPMNAHLTLEKNLPVASGIGGGSADAAATLRLLARLHGRKLEPHELASLALCLGADVPVCLDPAPAFMWGKGELIKRLSALPSFWLLLVNPGVAVSTGEVFTALKAGECLDVPASPPLPLWDDLGALVEWLAARGNDLEAPAKHLAPVIGEVIAAIAATSGCKLARMSGSGATCFGLYADEKSAQQAQAAIKAAYPQWWVKAAARL